MDEVIQKLKDHDKRFDDHDKRFDQLDKQVDFLAHTVAEHTEQLDTIARTVADHTERLDRIEDKLDGTATKSDISKVMDTLDTLVVLAKKKDQELTVLGHNLKKVTDRVDLLEKSALGLS